MLSCPESFLPLLQPLSTIDLNSSQRTTERLAMETSKVDEYRGSGRSADGARPSRTNRILPTNGREYIESSHRSVLARGTDAVMWDPPQHAIRSPSRQDSDYRRPYTPVPSLINSGTMSLRSANTISPTTPVFDAAAHPPFVSRSSQQRRPTPLDFDRLQLNTNMDRSIQLVGQADFDPASTYQPRRLVINNLSAHSSQQTPTSASTDETSFIDWDDDDDSTRFRRMKQSFPFRRPHHANNTSQYTTKNPDRYFNAIPRTPFRTKSSSKPQSRSATPQPLTKSATLHSAHQRTPLIRAPASFDQPRYHPVDTSTHTRPPPVARYSEDTLVRPKYLTIPSRQTQLQPYNDGSRAKALPAVPTHDSLADASRGSLQQLSHTRHSNTRPRIRHHDQLERVLSTVSNKGIDPPPGKPKRFMDMMHGVMERVSMRDLRKDVSKGK